MHLTHVLLLQPITVFGEGPGERRNRLKDYLADDKVILPVGALQMEEVKNTEQNKEVWYHEGSQQLMEARQWIAAYSLPRANERLQEARKTLAMADSSRTVKRQELHLNLRSFSNYGSQVAKLLFG